MIESRAAVNAGPDLSRNRRLKTEQASAPSRRSGDRHNHEPVMKGTSVLRLDATRNESPIGQPRWSGDRRVHDLGHPAGLWPSCSRSHRSREISSSSAAWSWLISAARGSGRRAGFAVGRSRRLRSRRRPRGRDDRAGAEGRGHSNAASRAPSVASAISFRPLRWRHRTHLRVDSAA
jgi:hypothetical protein